MANDRHSFVYFAAAILISLGAAAAPRPALAAHPQVLVTADDREAIQLKIHTAGWATRAFDAVRARIDRYLSKCEADPKFLSSRLAMNWQTRYTTPVCERSRWVGGEGTAPVPTPGFAGARDWATPFSAPADIGDFKPHNDDDAGRIRGPAWRTPFVAVYEPYVAGEGATIQSVRQARIEGDDDGSAVACVVQGHSNVDGKAVPFAVYLLQGEDAHRTYTVKGHALSGVFAGAIVRGGVVIESYPPAAKTPGPSGRR